MWGLKGILGKAIVMIASGSGIGVGGLSELFGGGQKTDKRVTQVKAGWGKEIYQKAKDIQLTQMGGTSSGKGWTYVGECTESNHQCNGKKMKYKWEGEWKFVRGSSENYWLLKNGNDCWGLVVGKSGGKNVKWRKIKGKIEGNTCKLELNKKWWVFEGNKWTKGDNSATLNR